jgi:hypothetical protein
LSPDRTGELHDFPHEGVVFFFGDVEMIVNGHKNFKLEDDQLLERDTHCLLEFLIVEESLIPFVVNDYFLIIFDCKDYAGTHEST